MLLLTSVSDKLQVITGSALNVDVHASYIDYNGTTVTPGRLNTAITTATTTDVVAAPAASTQRSIKALTVRNKDASSSQTVTVRHTDGTTIVELWKGALAAGEELYFIDGMGFRVLDATGSEKVTTSAAGRFLQSTVLTSGTTFTTGPSTNRIRVRLVGGGGGGGGCTSVAAAASAGGGGGAGGYAEKVFAVSPNTGYTIAIGAAGNGVSGAGGGNGGNTTFAVGATTVTAFGGSGAPVATAATALTAYRGGAGGVISTNGDVNSAGAPGEPGATLIVATPVVAAGNGGSGVFGGGGLGVVAVGNGSNAAGLGAGGGGAATGASVARTGGNGTGGCIVVEEFA